MSSSTPANTRHAQMQWWKRNPDRNIDLQSAWKISIPVALPDYDYDSARLYEPKNIAILERDGVITTVLHSSNIEIVDDHLVVCPECGNRVNKGPEHETAEEACPWCNADEEILNSSYQPLQQEISTGSPNGADSTSGAEPGTNPTTSTGAGPETTAEARTATGSSNTKYSVKSD